jgi:hypothetical protein
MPVGSLELVSAFRGYAAILKCGVGVSCGSFAVIGNLLFVLIDVNNSYFLHDLKLLITSIFSMNTEH